MALEQVTTMAQDIEMAEGEAARAEIPLAEYLMSSLNHSRMVAGENAEMWGEAQERIKQLEAAVDYAMEHVEVDHYYVLGNMAAAS